MDIQHIFDCNYFDQKSFENKKILLYGTGSSYHDRLNSYLKNKSIETLYFMDDFDYALEQLLQIKPLFSILSFAQNENALLEAIRMIREFSSSTHIIVQLQPNSLGSLKIENLNVSGIISPNAEFAEIFESLKMILQGYRFLGKGIKSEIKANLPINTRVTNQEYKIMTLLKEGITRNQQIAEQLYVSPHTVKNHKDNLLKKFNLSSVQDLYFFARQVIIQQLHKV